MTADYARRDKYLGWLAGQVLRFASPKYRKMIIGSIKYGLMAAARDEETAQSDRPGTEGSMGE